MGVIKQAGQLNRRFTLEQKTETTGDAVVTTPVIAEFWGSLEGLTGTHTSGIAADADYRIRLYYREDINVRTMRLGLKGTTRKFEFRSPPLDPDGRRSEMVAFLTELV